MRPAPVFLTFLASKPGPVWRLTIQQNQHCLSDEEVVGSGEGELLDVITESGLDGGTIENPGGTF